MIGQTINHYQITAKLGAGGMGEVFLAEDTKLKRKVALKFLPQHFSGDPEARSRFQREAEALAALNHPNIVVVYDVSEHEGRPYIAMEYLEGESIKELIAGGDVGINRAIEIISQISEGLAAAHEAKIVHRDIKSDNIIVTPSGRVKIMDFGLATWRGVTKITQEGSTVGTMAYMSPEQAQGEAVDHRADLWSLGVVLYELVSGRMPFAGDHHAAVTYAITNEAPEPLARYRANLPGRLQETINRLLEKDPGRRYQSAADLTADLKRIGTTPAVVRRRSPRRMILRLTLGIGAVVVLANVAYRTFTPYRDAADNTVEPNRVMLAVLPFENLGSDDQEYFADGITEEITARLAGIPGLGVIARTSILQYKGTVKPVQEIGAELGVDYILEGTIRWEKTPGAPDRVRVTPQLINVADATHLWANVYDEVLTSVFKVQSDIAGEVVSALNITLLEPERVALTSAPTDNLDAFDYYLRGREYMQEWKQDMHREPMRAAIRLFSQAVALDSGFAAAYAMLARAYTELYWHHATGDDSLLTAARRALDEAMPIAPSLPGAHTALGSIYYHEGSYERALEEFDIALASQPNNADVLAEIGYTYRRLGKWAETIWAFEKAVEFDPRSSANVIALGFEYLKGRRFDEADKTFDRAIAFAPDDLGHYLRKAGNHVSQNGDVESARAVLAAGFAMGDPDLRWKLFSAKLDVYAGQFESALATLSTIARENSVAMLLGAAFIHGLTGDTAREYAYYDSVRVVEEKRTAIHQDNAHYHGNLGIAYAGLGRAEDAVREGERAVELKPLEEDFWLNEDYTITLFQIYAMVGEDDKAMDLLESCMSRPSSFASVAHMRLDPIYEHLRDHPRFQALLEKGDKVF